MSDVEFTTRPPPVDDGQEKDYEDALAAADSDRDSDVLSEADENQFEDYDPETANIEDRPVEIDEDVARTLKASKRKRADGEASKKPKEGRREKKRRDKDDDVVMDDGVGEQAERKPRRARRGAEGGATRKQKSPSPEVDDDEHLDPAERRSRAIDRMIDAAIKKPGRGNKKKDEIDLEDEIDDRLAELKVRMERACQADNSARSNDMPALHKLKLLPEVTEILTRQNIQDAVLDPDTNFLQHVKFFLEPLNDGSLPAYNIQREIFQALTKLNIGKEALLSSGIGKVVLFYTRSKKPEQAIKRMAEKLLGEWSRPILKRTDDYKKRHIETRDYDYQAVKLAQRQKMGSQFNLTQRPAQVAAQAERDRLLAPVGGNNMARISGMPSTYTIAPNSTFDPDVSRKDHRPLGANGMEAFRRMAARQKKK